MGAPLDFFYRPPAVFAGRQVRTADDINPCSRCSYVDYSSSITYVDIKETVEIGSFMQENLFFLNFFSI